MKAVIKKIIYSILIIISCILLAISLYIRNEFGNPQFEQIIDTMYTPKGSSEEVILNGVKYCIPIVVILGIVLIVPIYLKNKKELTFSIKRVKIKLLPYSKGLYTFLVTLTFGMFSLLSTGFFTWGYNQIKVSRLFENYYVDPSKVDIVFPDDKKNLIYIYMESMESSFNSFNFDSENVNVIPNLTKIAKNNINFSNTSGLGGALRTPLTTWTAAGTVAQMGGIPLKSSVKRNKYGVGSESFLPGATMIGDILEKEGYHNYYLLGSKSKFAGTDHLFTTHGNYEILDYNWAKKENRIAEDYKLNWGFEDSKLYRMAKEELLRISREEEYPFNFTMITIDTHAVDGYTDEKCKKEFDYKYANSLKCADTMLYEFLNWLEEQEFYDNTVIIISGDHLTMQTNVKDHLTNPSNRTIYNAFINTNIEDVNNKNREFTTMDMFPTTLAALGAEIKGDRLGLGTNLFSERKTLVEEIGYRKLCDEIARKSEYYDKYLLN